MVGGSDRQASPSWTPLEPKPRRRARSRFRVLAAAGGGAVLASALLAACGTSSASTGPVTLNFYNFPDPSGAVQYGGGQLRARRATGATRSSTSKLQTAADQQRLQMARRLAAHDASMDILGLDVTWEAEFAQAGWIRPWTGALKQQAVAGTLDGPLQTAIWQRPAGRGALQQQHPAALVPVGPGEEATRPPGRRCSPTPRRWPSRASRT